MEPGLVVGTNRQPSAPTGNPRRPTVLTGPAVAGRGHHEPVRLAGGHALVEPATQFVVWRLPASERSDRAGQTRRDAKHMQQPIRVELQKKASVGLQRIEHRTSPTAARRESPTATRRGPRRQIMFGS